jgi:hypothetical protein
MISLYFDHIYEAWIIIIIIIIIIISEWKTWETDPEKFHTMATIIIHSMTLHYGLVKQGKESGWRAARVIYLLKLFIGQNHSACGQKMGFVDNTASPWMRHYDCLGRGWAICYEIWTSFVFAWQVRKKAWRSAHRALHEALLKLQALVNQFETFEVQCCDLEQNHLVARKRSVCTLNSSSTNLNLRKGAKQHVSRTW